MKVSLVILTLNEIEGLKEIFSKIPQDAVDEIFAVDGGSDDGTVEYFQEHGVPVHGQDLPGRGGAFQKAFEVAEGDYLIFFSPDGNEDPADISKFKPFMLDEHDLIIATRMVDGARNEEDDLFFRWRKWANQTFTLIANLAWNRNQYVTDTINGYRALSRTRRSFNSP